MGKKYIIWKKLNFAASQWLIYGREMKYVSTKNNGYEKKASSKQVIRQWVCKKVLYVTVVCF